MNNTKYTAKKVENKMFSTFPDLKNVTKEEFINFIKENYKGYEYNTLLIIRRTVNNVIAKYNNIENIITNKDIKLEIKNKEYITKEELLGALEEIQNPQDRFILYGLYCNIQGKDFINLRNLKIKDIDLNNRTLNLPDGTVYKYDNVLEKIILDTIEEEYYYVNEHINNVIPEIKLNKNSEYLIRTRPSKISDGGLKPLSRIGIHKKQKKIFDFLGLDLLAKDLFSSNLLEQMRNNFKDRKIKVEDINIWKKENNINLNSHKFYLMLKNLK